MMARVETDRQAPLLANGGTFYSSVRCSGSQPGNLDDHLPRVFEAGKIGHFAP